MSRRQNSLNSLTLFQIEAYLTLILMWYCGALLILDFFKRFEQIKTQY